MKFWDEGILHLPYFAEKGHIQLEVLDSIQRIADKKLSEKGS
jgi:hypothetical protein